MREYLIKHSFNYEIPYNEIHELIHDKVILITGASGSIGSSLAEKILISNINFKLLILHDMNENSLYHLRSNFLYKYNCHIKK